MSRSGAPQLHDTSHPANVVIIAAQWHTIVMDGLIAGAQAAIAQSTSAQSTSAQSTSAESGTHNVTIERAPGSFELPLLAQAHAQAGADVIIALGVIIRGGTPHFEYVASATTQGLMRVCLDTSTPIGFGILTCDNYEQALDRAGLPESHEDKGREAAQAALATFAAAGAALSAPDAAV